MKNTCQDGGPKDARNNGNPCLMLSHFETDQFVNFFRGHVSRAYPINAFLPNVNLELLDTDMSARPILRSPRR